MTVEIVRRILATYLASRILPTRGRVEPHVLASKTEAGRTTPARWRVRDGTPGVSRCCRGSGTCSAASARRHEAPWRGPSDRGDPFHASHPGKLGETCPSRARMRRVRECPGALLTG